MTKRNAAAQPQNRATPYVLPLTGIRRGDLLLVGGKGANLGEMAAAGFPVPPGFCVTTSAFSAFLASDENVDGVFAALAAVDPQDLETLRDAGKQVRAHLGSVDMPPNVAAAVLGSWHETGAEHAYAVRSSATAEDLPSASFAGQHDTYLNVRGADDLLDSVHRCWISLFTDRAILYRIQNGFDHRDVLLSVVVQQMVEPDVSGILFTADPVSGNRHIASIDASLWAWRGAGLRAGLGRPLQGGQAEASRRWMCRSGTNRSRSGPCPRAARNNGLSTVRSGAPAPCPLLKYWRWQRWARASKTTMACPRTSNGRWPATNSGFCNLAPSPPSIPCPSPRPRMTRCMSTSALATRR